jgi:hypothetical protein
LIKGEYVFASNPSLRDRADHFLFFLPRNFYNSPFFIEFSADTHTVISAAASDGSDLIWATHCDLEVMLHEVGHALGLGHSGAVVKGTNKQVNLWQDLSTIMGAAVPHRLNPKLADYSYRGLSAVDLWRLGVVEERQIVNIIERGADVDTTGLLNVRIAGTPFRLRSLSRCVLLLLFSVRKRSWFMFCIVLATL